MPVGFLSEVAWWVDFCIDLRRRIISNAKDNEAIPPKPKLNLPMVQQSLTLQACTAQIPSQIIEWKCRPRIGLIPRNHGIRVSTRGRSPIMGFFRGKEGLPTIATLPMTVLPPLRLVRHRSALRCGVVMGVWGWRLVAPSARISSCCRSRLGLRTIAS